MVVASNVEAVEAVGIIKGAGEDIRTTVNIPVRGAAAEEDIILIRADRDMLMIRIEEAAFVFRVAGRNEAVEGVVVDSMVRTATEAGIIINHPMS